MMVAGSFADTRALRKNAAEAKAFDMREALRKAKSELYEAHHQAKEIDHGMTERIWAAFNDIERLYLDARSDADKRKAKVEALLTAEYGPPASHSGTDVRPQ